MKIYFAADHAGFDLKNSLMNFVRGELGHDVEDCGAFQLDPADDFPDFVCVAARKLSDDAAQGLDNCAIFIGASGQGEAMAANRFTGVRCGLYYGPAAKKQTDMQGQVLDIIECTREHNGANALSLGARFITEDEAKEVVKKWLAISVQLDERHVRRIRKIDQLSR